PAELTDELRLQLQGEVEAVVYPIAEGDAGVDAARARVDGDLGRPDAGRLDERRGQVDVALERRLDDEQVDGLVDDGDGLVEGDALGQLLDVELAEQDLEQGREVVDV